MASSLQRQQLAAREEQAWRLKLLGKSEREIAEAVGLSQPGVHKLLARVERRLLDDAKALVLRVKAREHARLEMIFAEAMAGYARSQRTSERETTEARRSGEGEGASAGSKIQRVKAGRDGDPVWLNTALAAGDRIRKLWGLDAPVKVQQVREATAEEQMMGAELLAAVEREIAEERRKIEQGGRDE